MSIPTIPCVRGRERPVSPPYWVYYRKQIFCKQTGCVSFLEKKKNQLSLWEHRHMESLHVFSFMCVHTRVCMCPCQNRFKSIRFMQKGNNNNDNTTPRTYDNNIWNCYPKENSPLTHLGHFQECILNTLTLTWCYYLEPIPINSTVLSRSESTRPYWVSVLPATVE